MVRFITSVAMRRARVYSRAVEASSPRVELSWQAILAPVVICSARLGSRSDHRKMKKNAPAPR